MLAAAASCRQVISRVGPSWRASRMARKLSPGTQKAASIPLARRWSWTIWPPVRSRMMRRTLAPGRARPAAFRAGRGGLAVVEGPDERVGAVVEAGRVGVPQPEVQGDQVGVPEVEAGPGLRAGARALVLGGLEHEGPVGIVAGGPERPVGGAGQRRGGRLGGEDPFERGQLPAAVVALVDQDRGLGDVEALDGRVE